MSAMLGVATFAYAPFVVFNLARPLIAIAYGFFRVAQKPLEETDGGYSVRAGAVHGSIRGDLQLRSYSFHVR